MEKNYCSEKDVSQKCPHPLMTTINWPGHPKLNEEETPKVVGQSELN